MPRTIRQLSTEQEYLAFCSAYVNSYPATRSTPDQLAERFQRMAQDPENHYWGVWEDERLVGGFVMLDFQMNYLARFIAAGGIGNLWVDLLEKKRGIAKEIIQYFMDYYERAGATLAMLYPFRPDFYHQMGFGFGPKGYQYRFLPASLPGDRTPHGLEYLTDADTRLIRDCRDAYASRQHGEIKMHGTEWVGLGIAFGQRRRLIGYKENGVLRGYMAFGFKGYDNFVKNDLIIHEWVCDGPETRQRFCNFLRSQADQIHRIQYDTQDPDFHYLLDDVRDGSDNMIPSVYHQSNTAGVGLMYRIIDLPAFLAQTAHHSHGGVTANVSLRVHDTFRPANDGLWQLGFRAGVLSVAAAGSPAPTDAIPLEVGIAELSALLMGAVDIASLWRLGRARTDSTQLPLLTKLFATERPNCLTAF